jgi:ribosomal protein S18 acetylase RimI-like enzyme
MIKAIVGETNLEISAGILAESFKGVAAEFGLTEENCPTNPAFITRERLEALREKGVRLFGLFNGERQIGFAALEKAGDGVFYLEKLAVLPEHRHKGYGKSLVDFACERAMKEGGNVISIGIMDNHMLLKKWYKTLGFIETGTQQFKHLPFTVCFMEKGLQVAGAEKDLLHS